MIPTDFFLIGSIAKVALNVCKIIFQEAKEIRRQRVQRLAWSHCISPVISPIFGKVTMPIMICSQLG
jgi:hypothetical protein